MAGVKELVETTEKLSDQEKLDFLSDFISKQNVLWLANAVKALEEKFGVKAQAMPVFAAGTAAGGAPKAEAEEEKAMFDVILKSLKTPDAKLNVIKAVRTITNLGLKESKDMVEKLPSTVKAGVSKDDSVKIKDELERAGAVVELK